MHVMTRKVVTCTRADTIISIMELMTAGKFRHLPVVEGNKLIGIISIGDVVKHRVQQIEFKSACIARLHPVPPRASSSRQPRLGVIDR